LYAVLLITMAEMRNAAFPIIMTNEFHRSWNWYQTNSV